MALIEQESVSLKKKNFTVKGMHCASCAASIERYLKIQEGIQNLSVNLQTHNLQVSFYPEQINEKQIHTYIQEIGFDLYGDEEQRKIDSNLQSVYQNALQTLKNKMIGASLLAFPVFMLSMFFSGLIPHQNYLLWGLTTILLVFYGRDFYISAFKKLLRRQVNMDTLISLGTGTAYLLSSWGTFYPQFFIENALQNPIYFESVAVIIAFILIGKYLEEGAKQKSGNAIQQLVELQPNLVTVLRNGEEMEIPLEELRLWDRIIVHPYEKIPVDGKVIKGESFVDESTINGEALPVQKQKGKLVFAGTLNQSGNLIILTEKFGKDTVLAQITQVVKEAQNSKASAQKLADRIAAVFVPVVLIIAALSFVLWMLLGGASYWAQAILSFVSVLVVACPCALGLATPTAISVAIGKAAQHGILVRDAENLEKLNQIDSFIFDKTGTLTLGKPEVKKVYWDSPKNHTSFNQILHQLASKSHHPLSKAIQAHWKNQVGTSGDFDLKTSRIHLEKAFKP